MRKVLALGCMLALAACTNTHPVKTVGPDTYQLTHTMAKSAPTQGALNGLMDMARATCAKQDNAPFQKVSEDIATSGNRQTITLKFTCKPVLAGSAYTGSAADTISRTVINYVPPMGSQPKAE